MPTLCQCDISIIIPVFNLEHYIGKMIESLKAQDLGDYSVEYIAVLNNCTDRSEEIIRESGIFKKVLFCIEQGCGCARNVGYEEAEGEYIWFLDGDDWLLRDDAIKYILDHIDGRPIMRVPFTSDAYHSECFGMVWQYVIKREEVSDIRFRKVQPAEDEDYMRKVLGKIGYQASLWKYVPALDKPLYYYNYLRAGSNMWRVLRGEDINTPPRSEA